MQEEDTLIICKPDCMVERRVGEILRRFEGAGLEVRACKMMTLSNALLDEHYAHVSHLSVFESIKEFMSSRAVLVAVLRGVNAVERVRRLLGPTDSAVAPPGTIRGDYGTDKTRNVVHASDSVENARIEIDRFFAPEEIF